MTVQEIHGVFQFSDDFLAVDAADAESPAASSHKAKVKTIDGEFCPRTLYPEWYMKEEPDGYRHQQDDALRYRIACLYAKGCYKEALVLAETQLAALSTGGGNVAGVCRDLAETIVLACIHLDDLTTAHKWISFMDGVEEPGRHIVKSLFFYKSQEWRLCSEECQKYLRLRPGDGKMLIRLSQASLKEGNVGAAMDSAKQAIDIIKNAISRADVSATVIQNHLWQDLLHAEEALTLAKAKQRIFIIRFAQHWEEFRLPELQSVAKMLKLDMKYELSEYQVEDPFLKVTCDGNVEQVFGPLLKRILLVKDVMELWAEGETLEQLHSAVKQRLDLFSPFDETVSFKFVIKSFNGTLNRDEQLDLINSFAYTELKGPIRMTDPYVTFAVFCDLTLNRTRYFFGRYVGRSARGQHLDNLDLKKREYLGTTSMDAELSLVMTNLAMVQKGTLVYDPFVGTGSFLYTSGYFGGYALGSDIDGRQMRGKAASSTAHRGPKYKKSEALVHESVYQSIQTNLEQYGLTGRIIDGIVFDIAHHPWTSRLMLNAIVTDPPYGVRAGAKKLGAARPQDSKLHSSLLESAELRAATYPATQPYAIDEMTLDLLNFSAAHLVSGGRLVFWFPVDAEDVESFDIHQVYPHPDFNFVAACCHRCKGFHRWLVTLERK